MTSWWCEQAWLPGEPAPVPGVRVVAEPGGRISEVIRGVPPGAGDARLAGLVLPGFANAHSHAFHRALRGRTEDVSSADRGADSFWTWRTAMYDLAGRLDPDRYLDLATAAYAEMALAGVTCVGEFHYLHHAPGGRRYADPNAMAEALREAARRAGIRITLLDTCYLAGGLDPEGGYLPLNAVQARFGDGDAAGWAERVAGLQEDETFRAGAAVHSVRAVPPAALAEVAVAAAGRPLHVHLSEQPAENEACLAVHGLTPTALLAEHGVLGAHTTAVHATHLTAGDIRLLGDSRTCACLCPTTERDLADGIGPATELREAGSPISLGSDQHAVTDLLEEARGLEMHARLRSGRRGAFTPAALVEALSAAGHACLGWPDAGRIAPGGLADLVAVRLDSVRTAGCLPAQVPFAATAADVDTVVVAGRRVVEGGRHLSLGNVADRLARTIEAAWPPAR